MKNVNKIIGKKALRHTPLRVVMPRFLFFLFCAISIAVLLLIILAIFPRCGMEWIKDVVEIAGIIVAALALACSFVTFKSIDTVSIISRMEGNILDSDTYIRNVIGLISTYENCISCKDFQRQYLVHLAENRNKRRSLTTSGAKIADEIQDAIDHVPLLAFLFVNKMRYENSLHEKKKDIEEKKIFSRNFKKYVNALKEDLDNLERASNGSIRVLKEAVDLLDATSQYQIDQNNLQSSIDIMRIDSSLLRNKSSRCLYFKYKGLCLMRHSRIMLMPGMRDDIEGLETARSAFVNKNSEERYVILENLQNAIRCFKCVIDISAQDLFWSTIYFDLARAEFYISWFSNDMENELWKDDMHKAIENRRALVCYLNQTLYNKDEVKFDKEVPFDTKTSYLRAAMTEQYHQAVLLDIIFRTLWNGGDDEKMIIQDFNRLPKNALPERSRSFNSTFQELKRYKK